MLAKSACQNETLDTLLNCATRSLIDGLVDIIKCPIVNLFGLDTPVRSRHCERLPPRLEILPYLFR